MYCKQLPEVVQGDGDSRREETDREKRLRRSRTERGAMQDDGWVVQEGERGRGREEQSSRRGERGPTQGDNDECVVQWGKAGLGKTKPRIQCLLEDEEAPVQRSTTSSPGVSSSSRQDSSGRRSEVSKVEMEVTMSLRNGQMITTKYRVSGQAAMQCVIIKVCFRYF